ncbi:endonuclease III-like protein 1 [Ceratitis capitata]|uniref:endonuclease III-like protein 1 n=1 Tax=Ceratitis capitata TaxID=7213 RepID=UPI0003296D17|nr:endonuclease III-like protein 1 [Ceratitis capitata]
MSGKGSIPKTLSKKLSDKIRVGQIVKVQDIEDTLGASLFSPVQTRQQRKINKTQLKKLIEPNKLESADNTKKKVFEPVATKTDSKLKDIGVKQGSLVDNIKDAADKSVLNAIDQPKGSVKWEPENWRLILQNIRKMRSDAKAPVDTMGCHKCSDDEADEKTQRFQKLVALMLSSQTKDEVTFEAMQRLKSNHMTPQAILDTERSKLEELLKPVSFYKNKAKYLQLASKILVEKYDSDIPSNIKELEALPGVGPKMAHICMATAWNEVTGIGVDVHVHRITNRLKWLQKPTKEPEQTRVHLESWLPRDMWQEVNHLLVGFGQTVCKAVRPNCAECLNREICPSTEYKVKGKKKIDTEIDIKNVDQSAPKISKPQKQKIM